MRLYHSRFIYLGKPIMQTTFLHCFNFVMNKVKQYLLSHFVFQILITFPKKYGNIHDVHIRL